MSDEELHKLWTDKGQGMEALKSVYQKGRADKLSEVCKQISERVEYWDSCAKAMEKGSNEYKIFISLAKNFDELAEQLKEKKNDKTGD